MCQLYGMKELHWWAAAMLSIPLYGGNTNYFTSAMKLGIYQVASICNGTCNTVSM